MKNSEFLDVFVKTQVIAPLIGAICFALFGSAILIYGGFVLFGGK